MTIVDMFKLDGQVALVTGCKRGIGRGFALALADAGAEIVGVSATLEGDGGQVGREVRGLGRSFTAYRCDLSNREDTYDLVRRVKNDFPVVDILFSNGGRYRGRLLLNTLTGYGTASLRSISPRISCLPVSSARTW